MSLFHTLLASLALFTVANADVKDCGAGVSKFSVTKLSLDPPNTVAAGQNVSLVLLYDNNYEVVSGGTATTTLSLNGIPFTPSSEDLCTKIQCPLDMGSHDGSTWYEFPGGISGKIVSTVRWKDPSGTELLCLETTLRASLGENETRSWWPF